MGDEPKTRPSRDIDHYDENVEELLKEYKYLYKPEAKYDITQVLHQYQDLHPKIERCAHSKGGRTEELFTLRGTIPISFKEAKYHIPIQIYTLRTHPKQAPIVFVKPLKNMVIRPSKYVDQSGLVYLRYLVDWKSPRSSTLALCKLLSGAFSEQCPVFTEDRVKPKPNTKEQKQPKKKKSRFSSLRRLTRKDQPGTIVRNTEIAEKELLVSLDKDKPDGIVPVNGATGVCPSPSGTTKSDSSGSKSSCSKNLSLAEGAVLDDIPDDIFDESLDSLWSSSFDSLYSDRSITILAALRNQNIDSSSLFNSSIDSLLSDRSVSYLLDLERQWQGRAEKTGTSPQPSIDSLKERKEFLRRSLSLNKRETLRRLSQLSRESELWPTPPSQSPVHSSLKKHDSVSSDSWPALPHALQQSPTDTWPEPPLDIVSEKPITATMEYRSKKVLSLVKELSFENVSELPLKQSINEQDELVSKETEFDEADKNSILFSDNPDNALKPEYASTEYPDTTDDEKTPGKKPLIMHDKTFQNEIMKLDFTKSEQLSSPESTPRPMTLTKGGMVKRAEPTEHKRRWNFWKKSSNSNVSQKAELNCDCKPHNRKQKSMSNSSNSLERKEGTVTNIATNHCAFSKLESDKRSQSVDSGLLSKDYDYMSYYDVNDNPSPYKQNEGRPFDGGGGLSNGVYEKVTLVNGFSHRDHIGRAKIYEPITFGKARTKSENSLDCRYKGIGCTVHNEIDSLVHTDKTVNHHMDLLLDKVEYLTSEVQTLKEKLKSLGHNE